MKRTITPEDMIEGSNVIILGGPEVPPEGTPHRASWEAEHCSDPVKARELHAIAAEAWRKYQVNSFGGSMLRSARISQHEQLGK